MPKPEQVADQTALEAQLGSDLFLLFKHSPFCPVSAVAFREYQEFCAQNVDDAGDAAVATGWIDVVSQRALARWVAKRTGVAHQSPQALLVRKGRVTWTASHYEITCANLAEALE